MSAGVYSGRNDGWSSRPRYAVEDVATLLWRERLMMIAVFATLFAIGCAVALTQSKSYTANAAVLVQIGQEYVYEPRAGDAGRGAVPKIDDVVGSEVAILGSGDLKLRVVRTLGLAAFDPKLAQHAAKGAAQRAAAEQAAVRMMTQGLDIGTAPESGTVRLSFKAKRPDTAALVLNKLIETYLVYRREVFLDGAAPALVRQRGAFERQLQDADRAYESFLRSNDIGDFTSAKTALATTYQTVFGERATTEAMLSQTRAQLSALEGQVAGAPAQINTQQDLDLSVQTQLLARRAEREQLLARYRPESQPVQDINAQIAQLERMIAGGATGTKDVRVGPNPVWQELETDRARLVATRDSLVARLATLDRQLGELRARQMRLTTLESENANLAAQRDVLQTNYRQFTQREAESRAAAALAREGADNIVVIERAAPPAQGSSLKKPILVLAFLFAAFTAVCAGLMRVFLRRRFVTASSAGRTLDLPVLAVAPMKPARA